MPTKFCYRVEVICKDDNSVMSSKVFEHKEDYFAQKQAFDYFHTERKKCCFPFPVRINNGWLSEVKNGNLKIQLTKEFD